MVNRREGVNSFEQVVTFYSSYSIKEILTQYFRPITIFMRLEVYLERTKEVNNKNKKMANVVHTKNNTLEVHWKSAIFFILWVNFSHHTEPASHNNGLTTSTCMSG